jgi:hypothetical protein
MSGRLSTCSVKRLSTTSGNKQKTVNRNQEKTSFRANFCMGCINMPQIQGRLLHGVHKRASGFWLIFQLLEQKDAIFTQTIGT